MIITVAIFFLISLLLTIIVIPEDVVYPMIFLDVISLIWLADLFITKHANFIYISPDGLRHKNTMITSDNLYITMAQGGPVRHGRGLALVFYFDTKYLTETEIKTSAIKRKGFYMVVNRRRAEVIFELYKKEVRIIPISVIDKKTFNLVISHNNKVNSI